MARLASVVAVAVSLGISVSFAGHASAQGMSPMCGTENLVAGKFPSSYQDVRGSLRLPTDGAVAPEGAQWDAPVGVTFDTPAGSLTYDLGQPTPISAFMVQADANDTYKIFGSTDGTVGSYKVIGEIESVLHIGHGLRTRTLNINTTEVRYVRIGEALGDGFYSVSEFQVFCKAPDPFPPKLRIVDAPPAKVVELPWWKFGWWENDASSRFEMSLAFFALALVGWGLWLTRKGQANRFQRLRDGLLIAVGALSFCAYWNFFSFHFGNYTHIWDTYHYYIGSKYFDELSYDRLYECAAVADSEDPSLLRRVEMRKIMNLRTNILGGTQEILAHPDSCKQHFSPERWKAFKQDIAYFRNHHGVKRWEEAQTDHGYNGTPVWNIAGTILANTGPATDNQLWVLTRIDPLFILGITLLTWWAFGWRVMCICLAVFATNFPSRFYWTGGAYLRWDWIFYLVAGICLVRKERPLLGGFFLGYTTLLRVFPVFVFTGPALVVLQQLWGIKGHERTGWAPKPLEAGERLLKRVDRRYLALFGGAALSAAILMPISLVTSHGVDGYRMFLKNTEKHKETPLTNYMGLRTIVAFKPNETGRVLRSDKLEDPWGAWKKAKLRTFRERFAFLYLPLVAGFVVLLWYATRGVEPWVACSMGAMMIAVGVELTCYYYAFLWAVALLYEKRREAGGILLAVTGITGFIDWAPTKYLPQARIWENFRMPQWLDEIYFWMSVATLIGFVWILYRFGFLKAQPQLAVEGSAPDEAPDAPEAAVGKEAETEQKWWGLGSGGGRRKK
jgi:hypothetical protein